MVYARPCPDCRGANTRPHGNVVRCAACAAARTGHYRRLRARLEYATPKGRARRLATLKKSRRKRAVRARRAAYMKAWSAANHDDAMRAYWRATKRRQRAEGRAA